MESEANITVRSLKISSITLGTIFSFIVRNIPMTVPFVPFLMFAVFGMMGTLGFVISVTTVASRITSFHPFVNIRWCKREKWWRRWAKIRKESHVLNGKIPLNNYSGPFVSETMSWSCQTCSSGKRKGQDSNKQNNRYSFHVSSSFLIIVFGFSGSWFKVF